MKYYMIVYPMFRDTDPYCTLELPTCIAESVPSDNESNINMINWRKVKQMFPAAR